MYRQPNDRPIYTDLENKSTYLINAARFNIKEVTSSRNEADLQAKGFEVVSNNNYPGITKYKKASKGRTHEVWVDERYGVATYILHGNDDDKKNGLVGTDGTAVIKLFSDKSYDYVKTDDFIDRAMLLFNASRQLVMQSADISQENKHKLLSWLDKSQKSSLELIKKDGEFDGLKGDVRKNSVNFDQQYQLAFNHLQQSLANIAESIAVAKTNSGQPDIAKAVVDQIKQAEIDFIRERGRPFIIKQGNVGSQKMVSMQFPLGAMTVPSSDRTGSHAVKLSNYVRDATGVINEAGMVELKSIIEGHSSYPPIAESNEMTRRFIATQAVTEKITQLATDLVNTGQSSPITVSLTTMMMLTPAFGKKIEGKIRKSDSEHAQLADTSYALEMAEHKSPLTININGKDVIVNVDVTYMNYPVNIGKMMQLATNAPIQTRINNKGFYEFTKVAQKNIQSIASSPSFSHIQTELQIFQNYYENMNVSKKLLSNLEESEAKLNSFNEKYGDELKSLYKALESFMQDKNESGYKKTKDRISVLQEKSSVIYQELANAQRNIYNYKKENIIPQVLTLMADKLQDSNLTENERYAIFTNLRYLEAESIFHEQKFLDPKFAYQYHVNYLLASEGMGKNIEAFCKSAEDRTGFLRVSMLANIAFSRTHKRLPDFSNSADMTMYHELFSSFALELSASIENTKYNSEARSLQVNGAFTNDRYNIKSGKDISLLAKAIYKDIPAPTQVLTLSDAKPTVAPSTSRIFGTLGVSKSKTVKLTTPVITPTASIQDVRLNSIPKKVDINDLQPNGKLIGNELLAKVKEKINSAGIVPPTRLSKAKVLDLFRDRYTDTDEKILKKLGITKFPYSLMLMKDESGETKLFAIYKGVKQAKHFGKGAMGTVKLVQDLDSGELMVLKTQITNTEKHRNNQRHELNMLRKVGQAVGSMDYERTIKMKDEQGRPIVKQQTVNALVMKLAPGEQTTTELAKKMTPHQLIEMAIAAVNAISGLHTQGILHRDIKPANMHFDPSSGKLTLVDFGTAAQMTNGKAELPYLSTSVFSEPDHRRHLAKIEQLEKLVSQLEKQHKDAESLPENEKMAIFIKLIDAMEERDALIEKNVTYTAASDVYSLGITLGHMFGMVRENHKPSTGDLVHYAIDLGKNPVISNQDIQLSLLDLLEDMTTNPPKINLANALKKLESIQATLSQTSKNIAVMEVSEISRMSPAQLKTFLSHIPADIKQSQIQLVSTDNTTDNHQSQKVKQALEAIGLAVKPSVLVGSEQVSALMTSILDKEKSTNTTLCYLTNQSVNLATLPTGVKVVNGVENKSQTSDVSMTNDATGLKI